MNCKHVKREGESCMLNNNCKFPDCENDLNMKIVKVKMCGECPFVHMDESESIFNWYCCHEDRTKTAPERVNRYNLDKNCPLKTEPVKIELK